MVAATHRIYCQAITKQFTQALTQRYMSFYPDADQLHVQKQISNWLTKGIASDYVNRLFTVDEQLHFPFWWSGFYVEDPHPMTNPIQNMKQAALIVNGYSSLNVPLSNEFRKQSAFWKACSANTDFKWGEYLSSTYTKMALRHHPRHIGLYLNKNSDAFLTSFFFQTELQLIQKHYRALGWPVQLHIFNLQENCAKIKEQIDRAVTEADGTSFVKVICKPCKAKRNQNGRQSTLRNCVRNRSTRTNRGVNVNR